LRSEERRLVACGAKEPAKRSFRRPVWTSPDAVRRYGRRDGLATSRWAKSTPSCAGRA